MLFACDKTISTTLQIQAIRWISGGGHPNDSSILRMSINYFILFYFIYKVSGNKIVVVFLKYFLLKNILK